MHPHVTQFETRIMQIHDEIRVRAEREALRLPTRTPGRRALPRRILYRLRFAGLAGALCDQPILWP
jgi:hypothetical protein